MVPNLEIRGRIYIPMQDAARMSGLSQTYLGRLVRKGVLTGQIIARTWFFDQESLQAFIAQRTKNGIAKP